MTRYLIAALILTLIVLSFYVGRASAAASSRGQDIPAASFVPVRGVAVGEPDPDLGGTSRRPHRAPDSTPAPTRGVPTLEEAKAWARARLSAAEWRCLDAIAIHESHWNPLARNPSSGAFGIPQAISGLTSTNPLVQVRWMLRYIERRYGTACVAWGHVLDRGWY